MGMADWHESVHIFLGKVQEKIREAEAFEKILQSDPTDLQAQEEFTKIMDCFNRLRDALRTPTTQEKANIAMRKKIIELQQKAEDIRTSRIAEKAADEKTLFGRLTKHMAT